MAASDHLSQDQFYHGTFHKLRKGQMLTPGGGPPNFADEGNRSYPGNTYVHATTNSLAALTWAHDAKNARETLGLPKIKGSPKTYEVRPTGRMTEDPENEGMGDYRTQHPMEVVRRVVYHGPEQSANYPDSEKVSGKPIMSYHPSTGWTKEAERGW